MGVAHGADAGVREVEALVRLPAGEDVLPNRIAWRAVVETHLAVGVGGVERAQERERLGGDRLLRPASGGGGARGEVPERDVARDDEVVVAGEADVAALTRQGHAVVRLGAVANEVAEAPDLLDVGVLDRPEDRFEGRPVAVHV